MRLKVNAQALAINISRRVIRAAAAFLNYIKNMCSGYVGQYQQPHKQFLRAARQAGKYRVYIQRNLQQLHKNGDNESVMQLINEIRRGSYRLPLSQLISGGIECLPLTTWIWLAILITPLVYVGLLLFYTHSMLSFITGFVLPMGIYWGQVSKLPEQAATISKKYPTISELYNVIDLSPAQFWKIYNEICGQIASQIQAGKDTDIEYDLSFLQEIPAAAKQYSEREQQILQLIQGEYLYKTNGLIADIGVPERVSDSCIRFLLILSEMYTDRDRVRLIQLAHDVLRTPVAVETRDGGLLYLYCTNTTYIHRESRPLQINCDEDVRPADVTDSDTSDEYMPEILRHVQRFFWEQLNSRVILPRKSDGGYMITEGEYLTTITIEIPSTLTLRSIQGKMEQLTRYLDMRVYDVINTVNNHTCIDILIQHTDLPGIIPFPSILDEIPDYRSNPNRVYLGQSLQGAHHIDITGVNSHILIGGQSGSGKTALIEAITTQLARTSQLHIIDLSIKQGLDYKYATDRGHLLYLTLEDADKALRDITARARVRAQKKGEYATLAEYNADSVKMGNPYIPDIYVVFDEYEAIMLSQKSANKEEQAQSISVHGQVGLLIKQGRSVGIHVIVATQTPMSNIIPTVFKNSFGVRIAGKMLKESASVTILDNSKAWVHNTPQYISREGEFIIQIDEHDTLVKAPYGSQSELYDFLPNCPIDPWDAIDNVINNDTTDFVLPDFA